MSCVDMVFLCIATSFMYILSKSELHERLFTSLAEFRIHALLKTTTQSG